MISLGVFGFLVGFFFKKKEGFSILVGFPKNAFALYKIGFLMIFFFLFFFKKRGVFFFGGV